LNQFVVNVGGEFLHQNICRYIYYTTLRTHLCSTQIFFNSIADSECPLEQPGFTATFSTFISDLYATFVPKNKIILQAEDGSECYPFAETLEGKVSTTSYSQASLPQCQRPEPADGFCAFVFEDNNDGFTDPSQCKGREYAMMTYDSIEDIPSNAALTHSGPCGVCSSAQDLSRRMFLRDRMPAIGSLCGTAYFLGGMDFDKLILCYQTEGFTNDCSMLWAHFTATNGALCAGPCISAKPPYNGDPPECKLDECLTCGEQFIADFDRISGRTQMNSGITENIARNCSDFYPVIHNPCPGLDIPDDAETSTPTTAPSNARSMLTIFTGLEILLVAALMLFI
jgi:hypothetical protein